MKYWSPNVSHIVNAPRNSRINQAFLAISVPSVTTALQKTTHSDETRENREKCQRIIDYVFGNGPFPYSDITGINNLHKQTIAHIIAQKRKTQEETNKDTDGDKKTQNNDDEIIRVEAVATSEDQPDIVSLRIVKKQPSSDNQTESPANNEEVRSNMIKTDDQEAKSNKSFIKSTSQGEMMINEPENNLQGLDSLQKTQSSNECNTRRKPFQLVQIKPLLEPFYKSQTNVFSNFQELDSIQKAVSSNERITRRNPFKLVQIKPLPVNNHETTCNKRHDQINTYDDEFLYENSCGAEIHEKLTKGTTVAKKEKISNTAEYRENTQDNTNEVITGENKANLINDVKGNEKKENSERIIIKDPTVQNTENATTKVIGNGTKIQDITTDHLSDHRLLNTATEKQNDEYLKPIMETCKEMRIFDIPLEQPKVLLDKKTTKLRVESSTKTKPNSKEDLSKVGKYQSDHNSIGEGGTVQLELFIPINRPEGSQCLHKAQSKVYVSDNENKNASNLPFPLISSIKPMHCNETTYIKAQRTFSDAIDKNTETLRIGTKNTVETMNGKSKLERKEDKKDKENEGNSNPLKNATSNTNSYHFDFFADHAQNQLFFKTKMENRTKTNTKLLEELGEKVLTGHAVPLPSSDQHLQSQKTDISLKPTTSLPEHQNNKLLNTLQQYPQQHAWSITQRQSFEMFSPKNFFIQNRPAIPASEEHVWKAPKKRKPPTSQAKVVVLQKLLDGAVMEQHWNTKSPKKEPSTVEHGDATIQQKVYLRQHSSQIKKTHTHDREKKPNESLRPESKPQTSISSKGNIPFELQNQHEEKHEPDKKQEEVLITKVKKQITQLYAKEIVNKTKTKTKTENEHKTKDQFDDQELALNDLKIYQQIYSATNCPTPEFKITNDMPLSKMMKIIRLRNQFYFIKEFLESVDMSKCGDKKSNCPPKAPICCPQKSSDPPVQQMPPPSPTPPPPCTPAPKKPKCPPKCKCKCKYVRVKNVFGILPRRISARCNIDVPGAEFQSIERRESVDVCVETGRSVIFTGSFDPWVPVPNYPYPKKDIKGAVKECDPRKKKSPAYVTPRENPCTGFPKRLTCSRRRSKRFVVPCYLD